MIKLKTNEDRPYGFVDEMADSAQVAREARSPTITIGSRPGGSVRVIPYGRGEFRIAIYQNRRKVFDEMLRFSTKHELYTAFAIGDDWVNDPSFSHEKGAEYGIPRLFARWNMNLILYPKNKEIMIRVSSAIQSFVKKYGW
jgi:hypothetical protein